MRSEKWRPIILKNPILLRVRCSLRVLLMEAIRYKFEQLSHLEDLYREKHITHKLTPSQWRRKIFLTSQISNLLHAQDRSVLNCAEGSLCKSLEKNELSNNIATLREDMVWNPLLKRWNCIHCYNSYYKTEAQKQHFKKIIEQVEEEEKAFDNWFSQHIKQE